MHLFCYVLEKYFETVLEKVLGTVLGTKVNNMASRVKGLICLWHHEHGRTYRSHDFRGGGRSRVLVSWRSTRDATSRRRVPWLATPCYLLSFPIETVLDRILYWTLPKTLPKTVSKTVCKIHFFSAGIILILIPS